MPDLLVSSDSRHYALRLSDSRLVHSRERISDFLVDNWGETMGSDPASAVRLGILPFASCAAESCVAYMECGGRRGKQMASTGRRLIPRGGFEPAGAAADVVVSDRRLPYWWPPCLLKLDADALMQAGGVAIWLDAQRVETSTNATSDRPWQPRRKRRWLAAASANGDAGVGETHMADIIDPERPIIDPHHHLWDRRFVPQPATGATDFEQAIGLSPLYLLDQLNADMKASHNVVATVFLECGAFYRADGPPEYRCVGETEFVNGVAAMSASGLYGKARACAGIVGHADLTLGAAVRPVLEAHLAAAPERFRGIRHSPSWDADPDVLGILQRNPPGLLADPRFRAGLAELAALGLSYDCWLLAPQIPELVAAARALPHLAIICDHLATPLGTASYAGRRDADFAEWSGNIKALADCPNVVMKVGGLAMPFGGFASFMADPPATAEMLAEEWRPWIDTAIVAFGADRCMFESNFPVDRGTCDYVTLWNAFKLVSASASEDEKTALFSSTAARVYRVAL